MKRARTTQKKAVKPPERFARTVVNLATLDEAPFVAALRRLTEQGGYSLNDLVTTTAEVDNDQSRRRRGISRAKLHRLLNGRAQPDLRDIRLLARAFGIPMHWLVMEGGFFVVREKTWRGRIGSVSEEGKPHGFLLKKGVYKYAAIDQRAAIVGEQRGFGRSDDRLFANLADHKAAAAWPRTIQTYVFDVAWAGDADMREGLAAHEGEEVLYVIENELEAWFEPPNEDVIRLKTLKPGDILQYPSYIPHAFRSPSRTATAKVLFSYVWRGEPSEPHVTPKGRLVSRSH